jgi:hypothetical protein
MRTLDKPTELPEDVYTVCVNMVRNPGLRGRLNASRTLIGAASIEFDTKITTGNMHTIIRETVVNGNITSKELEEVYTLRMAKKGATGRPVYDKILTSAKLGVCPLCSQREATTIDHYLPKTKYPRLSVAPINLVPCCKDCNDIKDSYFPTSPENEMLHPYYDNVESEMWLKAEIQHSNPCIVFYSVDSPVKWTNLLINRVNFQFKKLQLGILYSLRTAVELSMVRKQLNLLLANTGVEGVKQYLSEAEFTRSQENINSWQAAFYRAASNDNWFLNGGFNYY